MADVRLDSDGIAKLLNSPEVARAVRELAERVADGVKAQKPGADVAVDDYVTDRRASGVSILERQARTWQARDGILTRAAASAGLEVKARNR